MKSVTALSCLPCNSRRYNMRQAHHRVSNKGKHKVCYTRSWRSHQLISKMSWTVICAWHMTPCIFCAWGNAGAHGVNTNTTFMKFDQKDWDCARQSGCGGWDMCNSSMCIQHALTPIRMLLQLTATSGLRKMHKCMQQGSRLFTFMTWLAFDFHEINSSLVANDSELQGHASL